MSKFRSVEGVEDLVSLALIIVGASDETENLTGDGQNAFTLYKVREGDNSEII
mgnify:CR=1 FL=1